MMARQPVECCEGNIAITEDNLTKRVDAMIDVFGCELWRVIVAVVGAVDIFADVILRALVMELIRVRPMWGTLDSQGSAAGDRHRVWPDIPTHL
jgi:hypothetical protein